MQAEHFFFLIIRLPSFKHCCISTSVQLHVLFHIVTTQLLVERSYFLAWLESLATHLASSPFAHACDARICENVYSNCFRRNTSSLTQNQFYVNTYSIVWNVLQTHYTFAFPVTCTVHVAGGMWLFTYIYLFVCLFVHVFVCLSVHLSADAHLSCTERSAWAWCGGHAPSLAQTGVLILSDRNTRRKWSPCVLLITVLSAPSALFMHVSTVGCHLISLHLHVPVFGFDYERGRGSSNDNYNYVYAFKNWVIYVCTCNITTCFKKILSV